MTVLFSGLPVSPAPFRMKDTILRALLLAVLVLGIARTAGAQIPAFDDIKAGTFEYLGEDHFRWTGDFVGSQPGMKLFADQVDFYRDTHRLIATGNVLLQQSDHQIAADRADFDTETELGTFYNARGFAALGARADLSQFGTLQPDVQFYGETIEKIGPQTYLISHGGFTTCAQANPRWEMTSGSIKLRVDHYALLRNLLLKAKGVPVLFLPALYYPISNDNRQTGFLMPSYGSSSYRGQVISNGFFWAIGRSQDATILHDWYSHTGQAISTEYRYMAVHGSGGINMGFLNEKATTFTTNGVDEAFPGQRSTSLTGSVSQQLGSSWFAQGRANYFSNFAVHQRSTADLYQNSSHNRLLGGSTTGTLKGYRITGTYDSNEVFSGSSSSSLRGSAPRIAVQRPERVVSRRFPAYASVTNEYVHLRQQDRLVQDDASEIVTSRDIDRFDIQSLLRYPFNRLSFLTMNTSLLWRNTFWSDSLDPVDLRTRINTPIARSFFEMSADVNGPTFVKIWDAPRSRYKHTIEPLVQVLHRTPIDDARRIVQNEYVDSIVGSMTSFAYGASTRIYRKPAEGGPAAVAREILSATIRQQVLDRRQRDPERPAEPQQQPGRAEPLHARARGRARIAHARDDRHLQDRLRRALQPVPELRRRHVLDERPPLAPGGLERGALRARSQRQQHHRVPQPLPEQRHHGAVQAQPLRRPALVQLGRAPGGDPAAADRRLLQRAVLRVHGRVGDVRLHAARRKRARAAGPPPSLLGYTSRHREHLEHLRCAGRHAQPIGRPAADHITR